MQNRTIDWIWAMKQYFSWLLTIYTHKLRYFANKLQNTCTRVLDYTFGISTHL